MQSGERRTLSVDKGPGLEISVPQRIKRLWFGRAAAGHAGPCGGNPLWTRSRSPSPAGSTEPFT